MATNANSFWTIKYSSGITSVYKLNTSLQGPEHISLCQGIWKNTWDWYDSELHAAQYIGHGLQNKNFVPGTYWTRAYEGHSESSPA